MRVSNLLAWRYFKAKKSVQAINVISWISMGAIGIATAALIILFSVFNGLDQVIKDSYSTTSPELKVTLKKGKFFELNETQKRQLMGVSHLSEISATIEDLALLNNESEQLAGLVKGVDNSWFQTLPGIQKSMIEGTAEWKPYGAGRIPAKLGLGAANRLSIDVTNPFSELTIYFPKEHFGGALNPEDALSKLLVNPDGMLHAEQISEGNLVLIPLPVAQKLFHQEGKISTIEIKADQPGHIDAVQKEVAHILGSNFIVANRFQQNKTLYMVMSGEKWIIYAILFFVLLLASFNLTGCLYMLVLEKKKDISILKSLGLESKSTQWTFLAEGLLLSFGGALCGLFVGTLICLGQMHFGWIKLPQGFSIDSYPVDFKATDFLVTLLTVLFIGILAAWYPAKKARNQSVYLREE